MKNKINKFDNIFNCPKCNKTLWQFKKLKDGTKICPKCYEKYMHVENEKTARCVCLHSLKHLLKHLNIFYISHLI